MVESTEGSTSSPICQDAQDIGPDLTREGPFDACEAEPEPGQSPLVLNSMPGCQFRMTLYDDRDNRDDLAPAYGIHLHDPRMMEYMGAPESARLLGRSPEYWLEHVCDQPIMIAIFVIIYTVISLLCIYIHLIVICRLIVFCTNVDFNSNSDVK